MLTYIVLSVAAFTLGTIFGFIVRSMLAGGEELGETVLQRNHSRRKII